MPADAAAIIQTTVGGAEFVIGRVIGGPGKYLWRKYRYMRDMEENYLKLMNSYEDLCIAEADVKRQLERYETEVEESDECKDWRRKVGKMKVEVGALTTKYDNRPSGPRHYHSLMKLGRRIVKKTGDVDSVLNDRNKINCIMIRKGPASRIVNSTNEITTIEKNVKKLQEYLRNEKIKTICVWGPIGVGKSTIMKRLEQEIKIPEDFHIVIRVEVDRENAVEHIQNELLKRLKCPENLCAEEKPSTINEKLNKYPSYLLLLDEVISEIDLKKIGINGEHQGKVVFATRFREVCLRKDEVIEVERLSDADAEMMFLEHVGLNFRDDPDVKGEAELIIKFCSGMPYLIELIGNHLRSEMEVEGEDANIAAIWRNTRYELTSSTGEPRQMLEKVYKSLKLEIDRLPSDKKSCFLNLAIFPAGNELHRDYIIECWRAQQFLDRYTKLGDARDGGHLMLLEFVRRSLLKKGKLVSQYKMFEFYHRLALRFAKDENIYIQEIGREIKWEDATRISMFGDSCFLPLPNEPNSERILTLLLREIGCLSRLPSSFFQRMSLLQLLDLYKTKIQTLPSSISSLKSLKAMFLKNCDQLIDLCAEIEDLSTLEILDIRHTGIYYLPLVIKHLTALKCLRVSIKRNIGNQNHINGGRPREMISRDLFAELRSLEELGIVVDPADERWDQNIINIVEQVSKLGELTTLCLYFPTMDCFETFISNSKSWNANNQWRSERLRSFNIIVGPQQGTLAKFDVSEWSSERRLRFSAGADFPESILKILKKAFAFELTGHTATDLSKVARDDLQLLRYCKIEDCSNLASIIDGENTRGHTFENLNMLHIEGLPKLECIWNGAIESLYSLIKLKILKLKGCRSLKVLFSGVMVLRLNQLEHIQIEDCEAIEQIIQDGSIVDLGAFPKLKEFELIDLPLLSNICNIRSMSWDSLETLKIDRCAELKSFPSTFKEAKKLRSIHCTQNLWNQLVWPNDNDVTNDRFRSLHQPL